MENNLDLENLHKIMLKEASRFTPEYLEQLSKDHHQSDREYPENFSNWYPNIEDFGDFAHTDIVSNQIFSWEETEAMQKTDNIDRVDWEEMNRILKPTLDKMEGNTLYNIKNGCFSNKFDYQTCITTKGELARKLWEINYASSMFETGGYTELVVRKYIPENMGHCMTIYNGMPLRTEVRVFYNMDTDEIEYTVDYWDYEYCSENLHTLNDRIIFDVFHNKTEIKVTDHKDMLDRVTESIKDKIHTLKFNKDFFKGIWSIDFMYDSNTCKTYLIDMARGFRSAYWNFNRLKPETKDRIMKEQD